jgi:O-acetyl-ADP-ribose deacetylase (regulator of RNase III)
MLEFTYGQRSQVFINDDVVVRLESEEKEETMRNLIKRFAVTTAKIDTQNRVIKLMYTKSAKGIPETWIKSVPEDFVKGGISLLSWRVLPIGPKAVEVKVQIDRRFADNQLICDLSKDQQKLLLLCSPESAGILLPKVEKYARSLDPLTALNHDFVTQRGKIKVSVYKTDITHVTAECIVSAVDEVMSFSGGVSRRIASAAGKKLQDECASHIRNHGPLKVGEVFVSSGGKRWKKVLHVCGPRWPGPQSQAECCRHLKLAIFNCIKKAHSLGLKTIAIPAVSSGRSNVCSRNYKNNR